MPLNAGTRAQPRPWRSDLPRFRRRTWLLLVFASTYLAGFAVWELVTDWKHQHLASELHRLRSSAEFENRNTSTIFRPLLTPSLEKYWHAFLFRRIKGVTLRSRDPGQLAESLMCVKRIGAFDDLAFYGTGIREEAVSDLLACIKIKTLCISSEALSRTRMPWLNQDGLQWLCVARTQFSNPAIEDLPLSLTYLDATRTRINDEGLAAFCRLKNLKVLKLLRTPTSQEAIVHLRQQMPWCRIEWESIIPRQTFSRVEN